MPYTPPRDHETFWEAVFADSEDCILFTTNQGQRKNIRIYGRLMHASRVVWILRHGIPSDGMGVLHSCSGGNGELGCININHLYAGTPKQNTTDRILSDRHSRAKLRDEDVLEIRRVGVLGAGNGRGSNTRELADQYGIDIRTVRAILKRKSWTHL